MTLGSVFNKDPFIHQASNLPYTTIVLNMDLGWGSWLYQVIRVDWPLGQRTSTCSFRRVGPKPKTVALLDCDR